MTKITVSRNDLAVAAFAVPNIPIKAFIVAVGDHFEVWDRLDSDAFKLTSTLYWENLEKNATATTFVTIEQALDRLSAYVSRNVSNTKEVVREILKGFKQSEENDSDDFEYLVEFFTNHPDLTNLLRMAAPIHECINVWSQDGAMHISVILSDESANTMRRVLIDRMDRGSCLIVY